MYYIFVNKRYFYNINLKLIHIREFFCDMSNGKSIIDAPCRPHCSNCNTLRVGYIIYNWNYRMRNQSRFIEFPQLSCFIYMLHFICLLHYCLLYTLSHILCNYMYIHFDVLDEININPFTTDHYRWHNNKLNKDNVFTVMPVYMVGVWGHKWYL